MPTITFDVPEGALSALRLSPTEVTPRAELAAPAMSPAQPEPSTRELPRTASPLPLVGLMGLLSIATALSIRVLRH